MIYNETRGDLEFLNPNEIEGEFESTDLHECLAYYEEFGDIEPLRSAIAYNDRRYREAKDELELVRDSAHCGDLSFYKNKAIKILNILRK